jgi:ferrous iron transport protein B
MPILRVLLVGGPNVGKSTLFNALTGARQHTTNAPGTTVELATGTWRTVGNDPARSARERELIDLPGTYSLLARSSDEQVTTDALWELARISRETAAPPGVVVVVLDATALARSLYLLAQVAETGVPVVVALTMLDLTSTTADSPVATVDPETLTAALAASLRIPVVRMDARNRVAGGVSELARAVDAVAEHPLGVSGINPSTSSFCCGTTEAASRQYDSPRADLETELEHAETLFAWVEHVDQQVTRCLAPTSPDHVPEHLPGRLHRTFSDRVDTVLLNPWAGIPVFLAVVWLLFELTTRFAAPSASSSTGQWQLRPPGCSGCWVLATAGCRDCWSTVCSPASAPC